MRVELRPLVEEDANTSVRWRNTPKVWQHTEFAPDRVITLEDEVAWIKRVTADETARRFAIVAEGVYVGNIYLTDIRDGRGEYHVFIGDTRYWGRGVARLASLQLFDVARKIGIGEVHLRVRPTNVAAIALYRRLGFEEQHVEADFVHMSLTLSPLP